MVSRNEMLDEATRFVVKRTPSEMKFVCDFVHDHPELTGQDFRTIFLHVAMRIQLAFEMRTTA